jgi:adenosylcobinamide-GDP ribazoletransferase
LPKQKFLFCNINQFYEQMRELSSSFCSAVVFYTICPLPTAWANSWTRIARWASLIGFIIGGILGLSDFLLIYWGFSPLTRGAIIVAFWIGISGGLHLDGAMDTADGLAVTEPTKRLEVMKDSATGAFGAMAAIVIILLKTVALAEMTSYHWLNLILAAGWGRWGQLIAIALYPYLRETGKGAFHKENIHTVADLFWGSAFIFSGSIFLLFLIAIPWWKMLVIVSSCVAIALLPGYYFYCQLKGHTGDTYGAVVEWSEVLILLCLSRF